MSEFGFQSFPSYETIRFINDSDSLDIESPAFKNHQKHRIGFERIAEYMERDFPIPNNAEDYVYMSQLLQAYGVGKGIEAHRRARPYNMGSLYWQLNDCWPAVSWSSIDFFGNWKALHYQARHSFQNVLISFEQSDNNVNVYVVNDELSSQNGLLKLELIDFTGRIIWQTNSEIKLEPLSSNSYETLPMEMIKENKSRVVLKANFNQASSLFYFVKPKDLDLPEADLNLSVSKVKDGFIINLTSEFLQKNVFLFSAKDGRFSDNYFDVLPGEVKSVFFKTNAEDAPIQFKTFNTFIR
jgi:beta-mannosidase